MKVKPRNNSFRGDIYSVSRWPDDSRLWSDSRRLYIHRSRVSLDIMNDVGDIEVGIREGDFGVILAMRY